MKNIVFILISSWLILTGCDCYRPDPSSCPNIDTTIKQIGQPQIKKVNIFFDASGSMAGYMPSSQPSSEFQNIIADIISRLKTQYPNNITFYPIYNSQQPLKSMDISVAQNQILYGKLPQKEGETYLPAMLDSIYRGYFSDNNVNIFISDCIYSPKRNDIKQTSLTTEQIRESISKYFKDISTSIFCLHSRYLQIKSSPYYLMVFGKPENNHEIENLVDKSLNDTKQNFEEVNFGLKYKQPYFSILPYADHSSNITAESCVSFLGGYVNVMISEEKAESDAINFWVGIDLENYPSYATTLGYLDSNLILTMDKGTSRCLAITDQSPKGLEDEDKVIAGKTGHYIHISVSGFDEKEISLLHLSLKYSRPKWINQFNEEVSEKNGEKTFGLEKIMIGFEEAYLPDSKAYFFYNLPISIKKS